MTKIFTQKYIAQVPWLPEEVWSDHRRIGLPFSRIRLSKKTITR